MIATIDNVVEKLKVKQSKGIFKVTKAVEEDRFLKIWKNRLNSNTELPLVVKDEVYYHHGIEEKLGFSKRTFYKRLVPYDLLRFGNYSERYSKRKPLSTLSIAQLISWLYNEPIQRILFSSSKLKEKVWKKEPEISIRILVNAYRGSQRFIEFCRRQRKLAESIKPPIVREWHMIGTAELRDCFIIGMGKNFKFLREAGFFVPKNGGYQSRSINNLVNTRGLAEFIGYLYGVDSNNIFLRTEDDKYLKEVVESFVDKLVICMQNLDILPYAVLNLKEAVKSTGIAYKTLLLAAKRNIIKHTKYKGGKTLFRGIDLVIYSLRPEPKDHYDINSLSELFGCDYLYHNKLGIRVCEKGTFNPNRYVKPVYDFIADIAREKILQVKKTIDLTDGGSIGITLPAIIKYQRMYGMPRFDDECTEHLRVQFEQGRYSKDGREFITPDLIMRIKGGNIRFIQMKN